MIKQLEKRVAALEAEAGLAVRECEPFRVYDQEGHLLFEATFSNGASEATRLGSPE